MSDITLAPQQIEAADAVGTWLSDFDPDDKPFFYLGGYAGTGKAQPLDAIVWTPYGHVAMGALEVGDQVIGADGKPTFVTGVFPQGRKEAFRLTFRDGSQTTCSADHLWTVYPGTKSKAPAQTLPLKDIMAAGLFYIDKRRNAPMFKYKIPMCQPVEFSTPHPAVDAYLIGALIGDGYCTGSTVTLCCNDPEIVERIKMQLPADFAVISSQASGCLRHVIKDTADSKYNRLKAHLERLGLNVHSYEKFIPSEYLFAPLPSRILLLRGLMDTDGSITEGNRVSFSTSSIRLAQDFITLIRSLGGVARLHRYERLDKGSCEYQIGVRLDLNPFSLERKARRWRSSGKNPASRYLINVESIGEVEQQCISVSGPEGLYLTDDFIVTHNTTIAKHLASLQDGASRFAAFTGKAASVLTKKGCTASTIHSLLYMPSSDVEKEISELETRLKADPPPKADEEARIIRRLTKLREPKFVLRMREGMADTRLLIIDEVSMVDESVGRDLLSLRIPVLVLGDPGQLPPVKGQGFFTSHKPDFMLTDVHRQAAESPVIQLATLARNKQRLPFGKHGTSSVINRLKMDKETVLGVTQMICGSNKARVQLNAEVRKLRGLSGRYPVVGDKVICLRNNPKQGLLNGTMGMVTRDYSASLPDGFPITEDEVLEWMQQRNIPVMDERGRLNDPRELLETLDLIIDDSPLNQRVTIHPECFERPELVGSWDYRVRARKNEFDYGWCITCHKAQGSEWDSVLVFADMFRWDADLFSKWLYTGLTRASERVVVAL